LCLFCDIMKLSSNRDVFVLNESRLNQVARTLSHLICRDKKRLQYFEKLTNLGVNFVAIDFETANELYASACAVAIVVIEHGEIVMEKSWLVNPKTSIWHFTKLHGIKPSDVTNAPTLKELWNSELKNLLNGKILAAHNSIFEMLVLSANGIDIPVENFIDTLEIAREMFPHAKNHKLPTAVESCGYYFSNHHDPLADARGCALIVLHALKCGVRIYQINPGTYTTLRTVKSMTSSNIVDYYEYFFYAQSEAVNDAEHNYFSANALRVNGEIYEKCNLIVGTIFFFILALSLDDNVGVKLRLRSFQKKQPEAYQTAIDIITNRKFPQYFFVNPNVCDDVPLGIIADMRKIESTINNLNSIIWQESKARMMKELDCMLKRIDKKVKPTENKVNSGKDDINTGAAHVTSPFGDLVAQLKFGCYILLVLILCYSFPFLIFFVIIWLFAKVLLKGK
jgi:DNA polymerase III subunit epsilon